MLQVILVVLVARLVHAAGVPVAVHRHGLRPPVGPDAELGVAEPLGTLIFFKRFRRWLKGAFGNGQIEFVSSDFLCGDDSQDEGTAQHADPSYLSSGIPCKNHDLLSLNLLKLTRPADLR